MSSDQYHPDPQKLRDLATGWRNQAQRLSDYKKLLVDQVTGIDWKGFGRDAAVDAATNLSTQIQNVVDGANNWAQQLEDSATKLEKELRAQHLAEILMAVFLIVGIALALVLTPVVAALAGALAGILASVVGIDLATTVGTFLAGFVVYGALSLALDFGELAIVDAVAGDPFKPTWIDALNIGLGALMGGLMPGVRPGAVAAKLNNEIANATPKPTPLMENLGLGLGQKPPDIQIPHPDGTVSTISFTARPVPPTRFGANAPTSVTRFDASIVNAKPPTTEAPVLASGDRPGSGAVGTTAPRPTGPLPKSTATEIPPEGTRAPSVSGLPRTEVTTPTTLTGGPRTASAPPADAHVPAGVTPAGEARGPVGTAFTTPPRPINVAPTEPVGASSAPTARPNIASGTNPANLGHASEPPPAGQVGRVTPPTVAHPDTRPGVPANTIGQLSHPSPPPRVNVADSPADVPHPSAPPRTSDVVERPPSVAEPPPVGTGVEQPGSLPAPPKVGAGGALADVAHQPPPLRTPPPRVSTPPAEHSAPATPPERAPQTGGQPPAPVRGATPGENPVLPQARPPDLLGSRPRVSDAFPDTRTFGRPLEHIPEGVPPKPWDAASIQREIEPPQSGSHVTELSPLPRNASETTMVSLDGGRTWTQAPGHGSVANFDRIVQDITAGTGNATSLDLTIARLIRADNVPGRPIRDLEYYQRDQFGWTATPRESIPNLPRPDDRAGLAAYHELTRPPADNLTPSRPLTWDALRQHDLQSGAEPAPAAADRWVADLAASSRDTAPALGNVGGTLAERSVPLMYHGDSAATPPESLHPETDQPSASSLPSIVDRYYVSTDGGEHWTLFNMAYQTGHDVERGLSTVLEHAQQPGGGRPDEIVVATVRRGMGTGAETYFHLGPDGWRMLGRDLTATVDDLPNGVRTVEVQTPAISDRGYLTERWVPVQRWTDRPAAEDGTSGMPQPRNVTAREVEEDLGYAPGADVTGRPAGFTIRTIEQGNVPDDIRLFRNDGRGWQQISASELPKLDPKADPFGPGDGTHPMDLQGTRSGLTAHSLGQLSAEADGHESAAAFAQRRGEDWLNQARHADPPGTVAESALEAGTARPVRPDPAVGGRAGEAPAGTVRGTLHDLGDRLSGFFARRPVQPLPRITGRYFLSSDGGRTFTEFDHTGLEPGGSAVDRLNSTLNDLRAPGGVRSLDITLAVETEGAAGGKLSFFRNDGTGWRKVPAGQAPPFEAPPRSSPAPQPRPQPPAGTARGAAPSTTPARLEAAVPHLGGLRDPMVFMLHHVPEPPPIFGTALWGVGKTGISGTLDHLINSFLDRTGAGGKTGDAAVNRPAKVSDPDLPSYASVEADPPPRIVDGRDYGFFKVPEPEPVDLGSSIGAKPGAKPGTDAVLDEIDRIMAERRAAVENATGGAAHAGHAEPPPPHDEPAAAGNTPSLRSQAIAAMAKHEEMLEYTQSGLTPVDRPRGTSSSGSAGRPYPTIRDTLFQVEAKNPPPVGGGTGPGDPHPELSKAQDGYTRKLTLNEIRHGLEGVVHERRDLLGAQATGKPYEIAGSGTAAGSPWSGAEEIAAATAARLDQLDLVEAALQRALDRHPLGGVRTAQAPSTAGLGTDRGAVETQLANLVQQRRDLLRTTPPGPVSEPTAPTGTTGTVEKAAALAEIRATEAALIQRARQLYRADLTAELGTIRADASVVKANLASAIARVHAAAGRAASPSTAAIGQATEEINSLVLDSYRLDLRRGTIDQQLASFDTARPPGWALSAGTSELPGASVVAYPGAAMPQSRSDPWNLLTGGQTRPEPGQALTPVPAGYVLGGTGVPVPSAAWQAPKINGAVRIMPDVSALPGLDSFLARVTPWLRYHVVIDLRLVPPGTELPFDPADFATRNFVNVDVPPESVSTPHPTRGYPAAGNGARALENFASSYRFTPTRLHVPPPPTTFLPRPGTVKPFHPVPEPAPGSPPEEPSTLPLSGGWAAVKVGRSYWLGPGQDVGTPPEIVTEAGADGEHRIYVGVPGQRTPTDIWIDLHALVSRLTLDTLGRLGVVALGSVAPDAGTGPDLTGLPPGLASSKAFQEHLAEVTPTVFPAPNAAGVTAALQSLATLAWGPRTDGMPVPTIRPRKTDGEDGDGEFRYPTWDVELPMPSDEELATWTVDDWNLLTALMAGELTRGDQFTRIARYLAAEHNSVAALSAVLPIQMAEVLQAALEHPLEPGTAEFDQAKALHAAVMGADNGHAEQLDVVRTQISKVDAVLQVMRRYPMGNADALAHLSLTWLDLHEEYAHLLAEYRQLPQEASPSAVQDRILRQVGLAPGTAAPQSVALAPAVAPRPSQDPPAADGTRADPLLAHPNGAQPPGAVPTPTGAPAGPPGTPPDGPGNPTPSADGSSDPVRAALDALGPDRDTGSRYLASSDPGQRRTIARDLVSSEPGLTRLNAVATIVATKATLAIERADLAFFNGVRDILQGTYGDLSDEALGQQLRNTLAPHMPAATRGTRYIWAGQLTDMKAGQDADTVKALQTLQTMLDDCY